MKGMISSLYKEIISSRILIYAPFILMGGTLSFVDILIKHLIFRKEEDIGVLGEFYIQPVRGLRPYPLHTWNLLKTGFLHNKRIALYHLPDLTKINTAKKGFEDLDNVQIKSVDKSEIQLYYQGNDFVISYEDLEARQDRIFLPNGDGMEYTHISEQLDTLFSEILSKPISVLYNPTRKLSGAYNYPVYIGRGNVLVPVAPVHIISRSTVSELVVKADRQVDMERFRPNFVVEEGVPPYDEMSWDLVQIGEVVLEATFITPRCGKVNNLHGQIDHKVYDCVYKHAKKNDWNQPCIGSLFKVVKAGVIRNEDKIRVLKRLNKPISEPKGNNEQYMVGF